MIDKFNIPITLKHTICLQALTGSHNYNLNTKESDYDFKYFTYPTFDDLYNNYNYTSSSTSSTVDYTIHDIRKFPELFKRFNLNFIEILFSKYIKYDEKLSFIIDSREDIILNSIINGNIRECCLGNFNSKLKLLYKGTASTKILVDKFGYDCKQALHAYRFLDFYIRFCAELEKCESPKDCSLSKIFISAFKYNDKNEIEKMINIKRGKYTIEEYSKLVDNKKYEFELIDKEYINNKLKLFFNVDTNYEFFKDLNSKIKHRVEEIIKLDNNISINFIIKNEMM